MGDHDQESTLAWTSAWEAMRAIRTIVQADPGAGFERYMACAIEACARSACRFHKEPTAAP